jgi:hypothetical protein
VGEPARGLRDHLPPRLACRDGERHPGLRKGVALRGAPSERRPRSVRPLSWVPPARASAPATADVRRAPRRGTRSRMRPKRMHPSHARVIVACPGRRVLRSVLRPVYVNPHCNTEAGNRSRDEAFVSASRLGKSTQVERTSTGVGRAGEHGSPHVTAFARKRRGMFEKEGGRGLRPCEETRAPVEWSHVVVRCRSQQATSGLE